MKPCKQRFGGLIVDAPIDNRGKRTSTISLRLPGEMIIPTAVVKLEVQAWERRQIAAAMAKQDIEKVLEEKELREVGMFDEMDSTRIVRTILRIN